MAAIDSDFSTAVFRPAPEWRRVAIYCVLGCVALASAFLAMIHWGLGPQRGLADKTVVLVICGMIALVPSLLAWRSAIRLDAAGIWRRRIIRWDLWPWAAFIDGRIRDKASIDSFLYPDKPWYWRHLHLEFLTDEDRQFLHDVIRRIRNRPQIDLPEEVTISFGFRRHARFTSAGVELWRGMREPGPVIPWAEISLFKLDRIDHDRRDFRRLEFRAPAGARPVLLTVVHGRPTWNGADAELLAAFLQRHAPPDQLHVNACCGAPLDRAEYHRRLAAIEEGRAKLRKANRLLLWLTLLCAGGAYLLIQMNAGPNPLNWDWFSWLGFLAFNMIFGLKLLVHWGILLDQKRKLKEGCRELEAWNESQTPCPA